MKIHGHKAAAMATKWLNGRNGMVQIWVNIKTGRVGYSLHASFNSWTAFEDNDTIKNIQFTAYPLTVRDIRYKAEQTILDLGGTL